MKVRQIENVGSEQIEGRWSVATLTVGYDEWWLKDPNDASLNLPVRVYRSDEPTLARRPSVMGSYRPLGSSRRVHWTSPGTDGEQQLVLRIFDDDEDRHALVRMAEEIAGGGDSRGGGRTMCLLANRPEEKRFVFEIGVDRLSAALPLYAVYTFRYEDSYYSEDFFDRNPG